MLAKQGVADHDQWMTVYRRRYRKAHNETLRDRGDFGAARTPR
jgi:hypothetical protein